MNIRHFHGWALISSGLLMTLLLIFGLTDLTLGIPYLSDVLIIGYCLLFMVGLPGIHYVQPQTKHWGWIGLILMLLPPLNRLLTTLIGLFAQSPVELNHLEASIWNALAAVGIIYLGYIIVGWLSIQARVFPSWVGWLLLLVGISYDVLWFFTLYGSSDSIPFSLFENSLYFMRLLEITAVIGYGWNIIKYKAPRKKRTQHSMHRTARTRRVFEDYSER
ncbi:MAG TPA: hypothetical protein VK909_17310 [Anaerolineales bacterium]|nr:hypothetical protein [Anaerolineales bacterium]